MTKKPDEQWAPPGHDTPWRISRSRLQDMAYVILAPTPSRRKVFHAPDRYCTVKPASHGYVRCSITDAIIKGLKPCRRCMRGAWEEYDMSLAGSVLAIPPVEDPQLQRVLGALADNELI